MGKISSLRAVEAGPPAVLPSDMPITDPAEAPPPGGAVPLGSAGEDLDRPRPEPPPGNQDSLFSRVRTAVIGLPILLFLVLWPGGGWSFYGWPCALAVALLVVAGLHEFYAVCRIAGMSPQAPVGYVAALAFVFFATPLAPENPGWPLIVFTFLLMISLGAETLRPDRAVLKNLAPTWMGAIYIGLLFSFALRLRLESTTEMAREQLGWIPPANLAAVGGGALLLCFVIIVTASVDTAAYFTGRTIGRHKLAPTLSPRKTWEGAAGGALGALAVGSALGAWLGLPPAFSLLAAALISFCSVMGDLTTSAIKREIGVKDFGAILPGHGGVLDRFDSLLFSGPVLYGLIQVWPKA